MDKKFNVIFLIVDALRAENLSCYGYSKPTSPNIDHLAREGVLFENAYSCTDHTDPSFTTIFSGKHPISHGIIHHGAGIERKEILDFDLTGTKLISQILKRIGYYTVGIDWLRRWHRRGYDFYSETEEEPKYTKTTTFLMKRGEKYMRPLIQPTIGRILRFMGFSYSKREARNYTNLAIKVLKKLQRKNFFLLIHYWDVHTPFDTVPKSYANKFYRRNDHERVKEMLEKIECPEWRNKVRHYHLKGVKYVDEISAKYDGAINFLDHEIRRLLDVLKEENVYDQTLILLSADHGDNLVRNGIFVGHFGLYEKVIHVPLILAGAGLPRGKKIESFVQHIDVVPTILDMLDVDVSASYLDGKSLLPLIRGKKKKVRSSVYAMESGRRRFVIRKSNYKFIYSPSEEDLNHRTYLKKGISFRPVYNNRVELYDLKKDPKESQNIFEEKPYVAKEMEKRLLEWIKMLETKKLKVIVRNKIKKLKFSRRV